jgi:PAS domain S-box-containing protein
VHETTAGPALSAGELARVLDAVPLWVAHVDRSGRYRYVNETYATRLGLLPQEIVGRQISEVVGAPAYAVLAPLIARVLTGERVESEIAVPYPGTGPQTVRATLTPIFNAAGHVVGWDGVGENVTEARAAEAASRQTEQALREADRQKDEFLGMLAHELRNPLAPLLYAVANLTNRVTDEGSRRSLDIMGRQIRRLTRLVDDLMDVSRVSQGKITFTRTRLDLAVVIRHAVDAVRPSVERQQHALVVELPDNVFVNGDAERLGQIFENLLTNAVKYTPAAGRISVRLDTTPRMAAVTIADTGIGIAASLLPRIFDLFVQADSSLERSQGGLGIGLTLVDRLVRLHGGSVRAVSDGPGCGAEFVVQLPLAEPTPVAR